MLTTFLDLIGVACLAGFAYLVFPPAALLIVGVAALLASRTYTARARTR